MKPERLVLITPARTVQAKWPQGNRIMNSNASVYSLVLLTVATLASGADQGVSFATEGSRIEVQIAGKAFAVYNKSTDLPKPFPACRPR